MDKTKILRLCNGIEMIMCEIYNTGHTMQDCDYEAVDKRLKSIAEEISTQPKSNADRIRQMTDEELAEWLDLHGECNQCAYHPAQCKTECNEGHLKWLRKEVDEDVGTD